MSLRYQGGFIIATPSTTSASGMWTLTQKLQLRVPGAPTIGTATGGNTSASVAFTAPADMGFPAVITGYIATSTPSGITGTGTSSPIAVSGLTNGTAYTFTVNATNASGTGPESSASNSVTPAVPGPTVIGQAYGGGYYAGKIAVGGGGVATHYLIVAPKSSGEAYGKKWGTYPATTGITSVIAGPTNTTSLIALGAAYEAPIFCGTTCNASGGIGGYTDWYMPAKNELEVLYFFLKPGTASNNTDSGSNANAVSPEPVSTNYTAGTPAQTSAATFRTGASSQEFVEDYYWSSTEANATYAWIHYFDVGTQNYSNKLNTASYVRAVRRIAI